MNTPENLKYSKDHEWVKVEDGIATVGITDFAQSELGDIVFVDVETVDEELAREEVFGSVEAVKTVSDLFMPISGKILEFNESLESDPEQINTSSYEDGWIVKIQIQDEAELNDLLDAQGYKDLVG